MTINKRVIVNRLNGKIIMPDDEGDVLVKTYLVVYEKPVPIRQFIEKLADNKMPSFKVDAYEND